MRKFFILMAGFVLGLPLAAQKAPKTFSPLIYCPPPTALTIEGKLTVDAPESSFKVEQNYEVIKLTKVEVNHDTGFFRLTLDQPMRPGHGVRVTLGKAPQVFSQVFTVGVCGKEALPPPPVADAPAKSAESPKPAPSDALPPRILEPLYAGSTTFKVQLHTSGSAVTEVHVNEEKPKALMSMAEAGVVTVTLEKALALNQEVQVLVSPGGASQRVTVIAKPKPEEPPKGLPTKVKQPYEGDTSLTVTVREPGVKKFDVTINGEAAATGTHTATNLELGIYSIPLTGRKLKKNESVVVSPDKGEPSGKVEVLEGLATDLDKPKVGADKVTGVAHDRRATSVELFKLGEKDPLSKTTVTPDSDTGKFSIAIPADKKLAAGDILVARPDFGKESAPVTVTAGKPKPPTVAALKEGDKTVTGWVDATDDVDHAIALVLDHSKQVVEQKTGDVDATSKAFTVGLGRVLAENDTVDVQTYKQADNKSDKTRVVVETAEFNWGRVRAYFSLGAESSNSTNDDSFKKVRPYVALNLDENWLNFVTCYSVGVKKEAGETKDEWLRRVEDQMRKDEEAKIRAELDSRQPSILPRRLKQEQDRIVAEGMERWERETPEPKEPRIRAERRASLEKEVEQTKDTILANLKQKLKQEQKLIVADRLELWDRDVLEPKRREYDNYRKTHEDAPWRCDHQPFRRPVWHIALNTYFVARLQSAQSFSYSPGTITANALKNAGKVANFEFGIYAPINHARTTWKFDGQRQFLFMAPLIKGGLETIPRPGEPYAAEVQTPQGVVYPATLLPQDNFRILAGGFRVGHFRAYPSSHSVAPSLISWVDLTWGRWDRLPASDLLYKDGKVNVKDGKVHYGTRLEVTGHLKIPYSPFTIGVRTNTGAGRDEYSVFAGTRIDLTKILSKIAPAIK